MTKQLITIVEFLVEYSISRTAFYREVNAGRLKILKRGKRSLITRNDANNWVKTLKEASPIQQVK